MINIELQDNGKNMSNFRNFLNACKTIKEHPTMEIEKDRIKLECGSDDFRFYGEMKDSEFAKFDVENPFKCKFDFEDTSKLITRNINAIKITDSNGKIKTEFFTDYDKLVYDSELECEK